MIISQKKGRKVYTINLNTKQLQKKEFTVNQIDSINKGNLNKTKKLLSQKMFNNLARIDEIEKLMKNSSSLLLKEEYNQLKTQNQWIIKFSVRERLYS